MEIKYFAWVKDITNKDYEIIENNCPNNVNELKKYLNKVYPELENHLSKDILRFAVNKEYISENIKLNEKDEIAIFPPVSGG